MCSDASQMLRTQLHSPHPFLYSTSYAFSFLALLYHDRIFLCPLAFGSILSSRPMFNNNLPVRL